MANVFLIGVEREAAAEIASVASVAQHNVVERSHSIEMHELSDAGIVFAEAIPHLGSLLRRIRRAYPTLPVVAILETRDIGEWLDALDAGATIILLEGRAAVHSGINEIPYSAVRVGQGV